MSRKARVIGVAVAVVAVVAVAGVVITSDGNDGSPASAARQVNTAAVERGPLSTMVVRAGFLSHRAGSDGLPLPVINRASGTYTALPALGATVACGEVLYRVDDWPVLLLCGDVPAYRDLRRGDAGNDVRQLNRNLHVLGHDAEPDSDTFTARTESALRALQFAKGLEVTGLLDVDDAVVLPWSVQIAEVSGALGGIAQPGTHVLRATSDSLEVHVELDASEREAVHPGDAARITLPGNTSTTGTVERLGRIADAGDAQDADPGNATIGAYITLDNPDDARGLDKAPVQVEITTKGVDDALSVPVTAIFGRSGGEFAVEVVRDDGRRVLVAVQLGLFDTSGGRVQVDGDVRAGDRVVVPAL